MQTPTKTRQGGQITKKLANTQSAAFLDKLIIRHHGQNECPDKIKDNIEIGATWLRNNKVWEKKEKIANTQETAIFLKIQVC